jgi:hypothetical protein
MTRATILSATDDDDRVSDADDRASRATEEAREDDDDEDANRLGRAR